MVFVAGVAIGVTGASLMEGSLTIRAAVFPRPYKELAVTVRSTRRLAP